jgi:ribosomal protein S18 acetylase RimI-like enzyme
MSRIRPFRSGDESALAAICLVTADAGGDATGLFEDDGIWAEIFVLPYAARHPDFAFVVEADDGRVVGYVVAAPDTEAFEAWFRDEWWPRFAERWPRPASNSSRQDDTLLYAYERGPGGESYAGEYPAHLHIDLLPEAQGRGWGRRLIETEVARLREAGVPGLHLVASAENSGALAFYPRVGFERLPSPASVAAFGLPLT